jgi:DNA-binding helix-hairpin-helix protein with protein kinase domain
VRTFCDLQGREAGLGRCLGQGGEGAVYSVPMWPRSVAKIYARRPDELTSRKLGAMVQLGTPDLASFAAWPQGLLLDPRTGNPVGFLMPRVDGHREIHALYGPTARKTAFPDASWAFLVRVARNLAAAFDTVHRHGHVIGDVNQGNVVVSRKAMVRLIDCDSFQITHLGHLYPCRVGVPLFTPPELQGQKLECVERTPDHDRFGLAVLIFHLLFMGRHPFTGRHPRRVVPVEAAIREGLFAFGPEARSQGWQPPPFSLVLEDVPRPVADLFERAFARGAAETQPRPTAADWVQGLDALETQLVICGDDPRHAHAQASGSCPWCRIENDGGPSFFFLAQGSAPDAFDLAATWKAIEAVLSPGEAPLPDAPPPDEPGSERRPTAVLRMRRALVGFLYPHVASLEQKRAERRAQAITAAQESIRRLESQWKDLCGDAGFVIRKRELEAAKASLEGLKAVEEREWAELGARFRERRLPAHLRTFALRLAQIPGLGQAELDRLAGEGITTAADIAPERLLAIRYIDLDLVRGLLLFKAAATRAFTFDPVTCIPGRDRKALEEWQARRRAALLATLQSGPLFLAEQRRQTLAWRDMLGRSLADAHRRLALLRAEPDGPDGDEGAEPATGPPVATELLQRSRRRGGNRSPRL